MAKARKQRESKPSERPKKRRLSDFQGTFPTSKPYLGVEATRQIVARHLGAELDRKNRDR
jgi:hypothetical protein